MLFFGHKFLLEYEDEGAKMKKSVILLVVALCLPMVLLSQTQSQDSIKLTLHDCIVKTLENNMDITVETYNPQISESSIGIAKEQYYPQLGITFDNFRYNTLSNWAVEGTNYLTNQSQFRMQLSQRFVTGGVLGLSLSSSSVDTTRSLSTVNPTYTGSLRLDLTQPLLKNFGTGVNKREIYLAENQLDMSVSGLKTSLIQKIYDIEESYWNLVYAMERLKVYKSSLEQSQLRHEKSKMGVQIGTQTYSDLIQIETEVAGYENQVISAQLLVESYEDRIRSIMNLPRERSTFMRQLVPMDAPDLDKVSVSFDEAYQTALLERPEIALIVKNIENNQLDIGFQKNQLLPQLDLRASLWYPGQSGTRLIYKDNNPYTGEIIGQIPGGRTDSFRDVFGFEYSNWTFSIDFTLPFQNILSKANLEKARIEEAKWLDEMKKQEAMIYDEIVNIFRELRSRDSQIKAATRYRELSEKKLEIEERKYELGLVGAEWMLNYQRDVAQARVDEIRAIIDYKVSVASLERAMGLNLKKNNIKFKKYDM